MNTCETNLKTNGHRSAAVHGASATSEHKTNSCAKMLEDIAERGSQYGKARARESVLAREQIRAEAAPLFTK